MASFAGEIIESFGLENDVGLYDSFNKRIFKNSDPHCI